MAPLILALLLFVPGAALPLEDQAEAIEYHQGVFLEFVEGVNGPYVWVPVGLSEGEVREMVEVFFPASQVEKAVAVAWCESRFDPEAENPRSSAGGLFQFLDDTWESVGGGDKHDPWLSTHHAARLWGESESWDDWSCG